MPDNSPARKPAVEVILGFAFVWLLNTVQLVFTGLWAFQWTLGWMPWVSIPFLGFTQLVYVVPTLIYAHRQRRMYFLLAAVIAASVTFLLTTACSAIERHLFGPAGPRW